MPHHGAVESDPASVAHQRLSRITGRMSGSTRAETPLPASRNENALPNWCPILSENSPTETLPDPVENIDKYLI